MSRWSMAADAARGSRYAARFAELAASGADVHGEARLCASLVPVGARVLDAGCGTGRVAVRLAELGYDCVGVDLDPAMLAEARRAAPGVPWVQADLASFDLRREFDLVVTAGNVIPFVAAGTEAAVVARLAAHLRPGGLLVSGFGLDARHLPPAGAPVDLAEFDGWCTVAGLERQARFATWDGAPYDDGGYAVSVFRRPA
jgi:SAM-dependent methyltransferase